MIQFTNPLYLWSLAGLIIPIGIHLLSRKEGKLLRLGSLRHVQETSTQQFKGIRLNEILLMLLRCSLVILLSFLLSGLSWKFSGNKRWVLIENGLQNQPRLTPILDSLQKQGYEMHMLADNFPIREDSISKSSPPNYWRLVEQLKIKNLSEAILFSRNTINDFKGRRVSIPANFRWISQPSEPVDFYLQVVQIKPDSITARRGHSQFNATSFISTTVSNDADFKSSAPEKIRVLLAGDEKYAFDLLVAKAALSAINNSLPINLEIKETKAEPDMNLSADWCIWLSDKEPPEPTETKIIYLKLSPSEKPIVNFRRNRWIITKRLNEEVALKQNLTLALAHLFVSGNESIRAIARANDRRMLPDSMAWSPNQVNAGAVEAGVSMEPANPILLLLILATVIVERSISYRRNQ